MVIDASVLAKYVLLEPGWERVEELLMGDAVSLDYALAEVSNALWKHHVLYGRISREEFERRSKVIDFLPNVLLLESGTDYLQVTREIAVEHRIPIYDALYIAQALKYGSLATGDEKQGKIAEKLGVDVVYL
ncbi:type II toxin-antitoxin system VapC family toxin [Thermococcus sp.]|uniref:type II toxin-antitoxin system VapC family toxin n=1 Tax=Thermococcus sp. TaxID=35749 RepID=UPI00260F82AA|nr:type II toxin-antitoxin system VapC family toxin [Thermococcus sp.]